VLHTESRRPGRVVDGRFVPLGEQDTTTWSSDLRDEADKCIGRSLALADPVRLGRFQLEAAISAAHSARATGSPTDWDSIATLYRGLLTVSPSVGATVGAASALTEAGHPEEALVLLDSLPADAMRSYQPYWVCQAHVLRALGRVADARGASERAVGLTTDPLIREYLIRAAAESQLSR
jgi:RNA polymerase sigma-70 factor (ECF subfamily)